MSRGRLFAALVLALLAVASGWALWLLREKPPEPVLTGPPRSDYQLEQFQLIALDSDGREAFTMTGPRLSRHPHLGTLRVEQPRLRLPDADGGVWTAEAASAFVSAEADLLALERGVRITGPVPPQPPIEVVTERLEYLPEGHRLQSEAEVTVSGPGSILRGRGLRADLDARRFDLLADVRGRHEPSR